MASLVTMTSNLLCPQGSLALLLQGFRDDNDDDAAADDDTHDQ